MTNEYELANDDREKLIWTKEQLLVPLLETMEAPPHAMRLGKDERDYYRLGGAGVSPTGRAPGMSGPGGVSGPAVPATATGEQVAGQDEVRPGGEQASYSGQEAEQ
jgi:NADH-quinone oxidoreductase subunit I